MTPRAYTLMEMLVVLAIVAILAAIAVPNWQRHVERGRRADARAGMIAAMVGLERHALGAATFATQRGGATVPGDWPRQVTPHYRLQSGPCPDTSLDACVELRAAPVRPDPHCGTLVLRSDGRWLALLPGADIPQALPSAC